MLLYKYCVCPGECYVFTEADAFQLIDQYVYNCTVLYHMWTDHNMLSEYTTLILIFNLKYLFYFQTLFYLSYWYDKLNLVCYKCSTCSVFNIDKIK